MPLSRPLVGIVLALISATSVLAQSQSQPDSPGIKFVAFGRGFFKNHRGGAIQKWHEHYRNPNSELEGEWHTELHRGYRFEFIRGDRYQKDELGRLVITDPSIRIPLGIRLGDSKDKIIKLLGTPDKTKDEMFEYEISHEMSSLILRFSRGRLIEFEVSIDHE